MIIKIVKKKLTKEELADIIRDNFGDMAKVDVDIKKEILAIGGEWHSEGEELLNRDEGSSHEDVWGINFFPRRPQNKRIEYNSLINLKPSIGHKNMEITNKQIKEKVNFIVKKLLLGKDETL